MLKKLSDFDDEMLKDTLQRIREIASLDEQIAIIETDKLVFDLRRIPVLNESGDDPCWELDDAKDEIKELKKQLKTLKGKMERGGEIMIWEGESIRRQLDEWEGGWSENVKTTLAKEITSVKDEALKVADEVEKVAHLRNIESLLQQPVYSVSSVQKILRELGQAQEFLQKSGYLTQDIQIKIRQGRSKAAWYRARKKLSEAEVAEGGGNQAKAQKLRKEAEVLLSQDWEFAFPGEPPPPI